VVADVAGVEDRVARVHDDPVGGLDGDGRVPAGVAGHGHEHDAGQHLVPGEPVAPLVAAACVQHEAGAVLELLRPVAGAVEQVGVGDGGGVLVGGGVHGGVGEVGESARVVEVEVGEHDVGDVGRIEPAGAQLVQDGAVGVAIGSQQVADGPEPARGVGDVGGAEAGVDEDKSVVGVQQEDVCGEPGEGEGVHDGCPEVLDAHVAHGGRGAVCWVTNGGGHVGARPRLGGCAAPPPTSCWRSRTWRRWRRSRSGRPRSTRASTC
jgi:hypothetical protein